MHARTGYISDTDPVTRLGDRMDVVYLPDMEEQFVSGAPLTAVLGNNQIGILGVHFAHVQLHNPRSLSLCTTISAALGKVGLPLV